MELEERVKSYLKELAEVSKRHGLFIESCDCCSKIRDEHGNEVKSSSVNYGIGYDEENDTY